MGSQRVGHDWGLSTHTHGWPQLDKKEPFTRSLSKRVEHLLCADTVVCTKGNSAEGDRRILACSEYIFQWRRTNIKVNFVVCWKVLLRALEKIKQGMLGHQKGCGFKKDGQRRQHLSTNFKDKQGCAVGISEGSFPSTAQVPQGKSNLEHWRSNQAMVVGAQRVRFRMGGRAWEVRGGGRWGGQGRADLEGTAHRYWEFGFYLQRDEGGVLMGFE